jgi:N-acyl-D-amino-acid deacylase
VMDLLLADRGYTAAIYFAMSEQDLEYGLRRPWVSIGTDGGARATDSTFRGRPHPRVYGTFPRVLCRYVRERRVLSTEEAVRRFTSLPASRFGLVDRGVLRAGAYADLTLFDPATVCDRATFENPVQTPVGIPHVLVNGVPVVRDGRITGERPGRPLRRGR